MPGTVFAKIKQNSENILNYAEIIQQIINAKQDITQTFHTSTTTIISLIKSQ